MTATPAVRGRPRPPLPDPAPRLLRTAEAAAILRMSPRAVSHWAQTGRLPSLLTSGGHRRCPQRPIRELAATLARPETTAGGRRR